MKNTKKIFIGVMLLLASFFVIACGNKDVKQGSNQTEKESTANEVSEVKKYTEGINMCSMYSGTSYTIRESVEFTIGGQSDLHDDVFAFLAYRKTDDKYTTLIGRIDYTDLASADGEGELGTVVDEGEFPEELVSYVELEFSMDYAIKRFCFDENNIYVLGFTMVDGKFVYSLWTFENDGSLKANVSLEGDSEIYDNCDKLVCFKDEGTDYIALCSFEDKKSYITVCSTVGQVVAQEEYSYYIQNVFRDADGNLMLVSNYDGSEDYDKRISRLKLENEIDDAAYITGIKPYISVKAVGDTMYMQNKDGVYVMDGAAGQYNMVIKWADIGIGNAADIVRMSEDVYVSADVSISDDSRSITLLRLEKSDAEYTGMRKEVVIGVSVEPDGYLQNMVKQFNSSQGIYEAVIKIYPYSSDRTQKLGTEMITGNGPDLIQQTLFDISEYVSVGMIDDLRDYLDASDKLSESMLVESVLDVCSYNGKLAVIPAAFGISALPGKAQYVGADETWTFDEFMECVESNRGCAIGGIGTSYSTGEYLVMLAYMSDSGKYVDWQSFKAYFDNVEFAELLAYAAGYRVDDGYDVSTDDKLREALASGDNIVYDMKIGSMAAYQTIEETLGDDAVFKGYPCEKNEPVYHAVVSDGYAINSMSKNKEGAWKFIEFLVTQGYSDGIKYQSKPDSATQFPVMVDKLEAVFDSAMEIEPVYDENGEIVYDADGNVRQKEKGSMNGQTYYAATAEDVEHVRYLIEHIGALSTSNETIDNIIYEELDSLFAGQSTPERAAQLIQDRVQLYLDEKQ